MLLPGTKGSVLQELNIVGQVVPSESGHPCFGVASTDLHYRSD